MPHLASLRREAMALLLSTRDISMTPAIQTALVVALTLVVTSFIGGLSYYLSLRYRRRRRHRPQRFLLDLEPNSPIATNFDFKPLSTASTLTRTSSSSSREGLVATTSHSSSLPEYKLALPEFLPAGIDLGLLESPQPSSTDTVAQSSPVSLFDEKTLLAKINIPPPIYKSQPSTPNMSKEYSTNPLPRIPRRPLPSPTLSSKSQSETLSSHLSIPQFPMAIGHAHALNPNCMPSEVPVPNVVAAMEKAEKHPSNINKRVAPKSNHYGPVRGKGRQMAVIGPGQDWAIGGPRREWAMGGQSRDIRRPRNYRHQGRPGMAHPHRRPRMGEYDDGVYEGYGYGYGYGYGASRI